MDVIRFRSVRQDWRIVHASLDFLSLADKGTFVTQTWREMRRLSHRSSSSIDHPNLAAMPPRGTLDCVMIP